MSRAESTSFDASTELETWRSDGAWWDQLAAHLQGDGWDATTSTTKEGEHCCSVSVPPLRLRLGADIYRGQLWPALYLDTTRLPSVSLHVVSGIRDGSGKLCPTRAAQGVTEFHLRDVKRFAEGLALRPSAGEHSNG